MSLSHNLTPYVLATFFAVMFLALIGAHAWSHEQAVEAAQANAADTYLPADEDAPITDAVIETAAG